MCWIPCKSRGNASIRGQSVTLLPAPPKAMLLREPQHQDSVSSVDRRFQRSIRLSRRFCPESAQSIPAAVTGTTNPPRNSWYQSTVRGAICAAGCVFVVAAVAGAILPGVPTTPFLLLASWCFSKSSHRFERTLKRSPLLGPFLNNWERHRAITRRVKTVACGLIVITVALTVFVAAQSATVTAVTVSSAFLGLVVVMSLPVISAAPVTD